MLGTTAGFCSRGRSLWSDDAMRRRARVDANQSDLTRQLRLIGASVQPLHYVGRGCPDLLVGWRGRNWLLELKDPEKRPSARKLTEDEDRWHHGWRGQVAVVETLEDALAVLGGPEV